MDPLLVSVPQAAEVLDLGKSKVWELVSSGALESVKIGGSRKIPADALIAYIERLRAKKITAGR